jgi:integrase
MDRFLGEFLEEWIGVAKMRLRHSTYSGYRTQIRRHIVPSLGNRRLDELTPQDLNALYARLLADGRCDGKGGLSRRTVQYTHTILKAALSDAVRWDLISKNPADGADPPTVRTPEMKTWSADEVRSFLARVRKDRLYAMWLMFATCGMRRGEVLGLKWTDVDLDSRRARIRQTYVAIGHLTYWSEPKTKKSRRQIVLPVPVVEELKVWRRLQGAEKAYWEQEWKGSDVVFTQPRGEPVHPNGITRLFARISKEAGLPHLRLHDLRHTFATLAVQAGVHVKVVSEMLGHSSITVTLDTYSHVLPVLHEEAMDLLSGVVLDQNSPVITPPNESIEDIG